MIVLFIGKSAAGKDRFSKEKVRDGYIPIVSYTTRPIRNGEIDGVDYNFVTNKEFEQLVSEGKIMEYRSYETCVDNKKDIWYYGSPRVDLSIGDYVGVVTVSGVWSYIKEYGAKNLEVIYLKADDDIREGRARNRGSFDEAEWNRRLKEDDKDFSSDKIYELTKSLWYFTEKWNNKNLTNT